MPVLDHNNLICAENKKYIENYSLKSKPMICGKKVELSEAILEIKKILKQANSIHIDGMDCDISTIDKALEFAEKKKCSINHKNAGNINNLYLSFQKFGGSFTSFNELKNRSDLLIFIGEDDGSNQFFDRLGWNNKKSQKSIFFISGKIKGKKKFNHINSNENNFFEDINNLNSMLKDETLCKDKKFLKLQNFFFKSNYPVIVINIDKSNFASVCSIYDFAYSVNKKKRLKIFNIFGSSNSSAFVNSCVTKTGFPNAILFTEKGAEYDPYQIKSSVLKENVKLQIYISNFDDAPCLDFFNTNIYIGNPNLKDKHKFDVYIPCKTPGVDLDGLTLRSDGISVNKLKKKIQSSYQSIKEILTEISGN